MFENIRRDTKDDRIVVLMSILAGFSAASPLHHMDLLQIANEIINVFPTVKNKYKRRVLVSIVTVFTSIIEKSWESAHEFNHSKLVIQVAVHLMRWTEYISIYRDNYTCPVHYVLVRFFAKFFAFFDGSKVCQNEKEFIFDLLRRMHFADILDIDIHCRG